MTFGAGTHICGGRRLGRLMLWHSFAQLIASIDAFELVGPPVHLASNEIAGVVSLPVRAAMRRKVDAAIADVIGDITLGSVIASLRGALACKPRWPASTEAGRYRAGTHRDHPGLV